MNSFKDIHVSMKLQSKNKISNIPIKVSSSCRELLLDSFYSYIDRDGLVLRNKIILQPRNTWGYQRRVIPLEDLKHDIEFGILSTAGIVATAMNHSKTEIQYRKNLKSLIDVIKDNTSPRNNILVQINFLSSMIYSYIPIASLHLGLVRFGFNLGYDARNEKFLQILKDKLDYDEIYNIVKEYDIEKAIRIWNNILKPFFSEYIGSQIYMNKKIIEVIDFFSRWGFDRFYPFKKLFTTNHRISGFFGINRFVNRMPFYDRKKIINFINKMERRNGGIENGR